MNLSKIYYHNFIRLYADILYPLQPKLVMYNPRLEASGLNKQRN